MGIAVDLRRTGFVQNRNRTKLISADFPANSFAGFKDRDLQFVRTLLIEHVSGNQPARATTNDSNLLQCNGKRAKLFVLVHNTSLE